MSWIAEIKTKDDRDYIPNGVRFATQEEANAYADDLSDKWSAVREWRVVESKLPVNYLWVGKLQHISVGQDKVQRDLDNYYTEAEIANQQKKILSIFGGDEEELLK